MIDGRAVASLHPLANRQLGWPLSLPMACSVRCLVQVRRMACSETPLDAEQRVWHGSRWPFEVLLRSGSISESSRLLRTGAISMPIGMVMEPGHGADSARPVSAEWHWRYWLLHNQGRWFIALVGSSLVQQANRMLNSMRRAIFDGQVAAPFGAGLRERLFSKSSPSSGTVKGGEGGGRDRHGGGERVQH